MYLFMNLNGFFLLEIIYNFHQFFKMFHKFLNWRNIWTVTGPTNFLVVVLADETQRALY